MGLGVTLSIGWTPAQTPLGRALGPNLITRLPMTFGSNQELNAVIKVGLVRLPPRQWPKFCRGAAK